MSERVIFTKAENKMQNMAKICVFATSDCTAQCTDRLSTVKKTRMNGGIKRQAKKTTGPVGIA